MFGGELNLFNFTVYFIGYMIGAVIGTYLVYGIYILSEDVKEWWRNHNIKKYVHHSDIIH